jgi:hypothetical protein
VLAVPGRRPVASASTECLASVAGSLRGPRHLADEALSSPVAVIAVTGTAGLRIESSFRAVMAQIQFVDLWMALGVLKSLMFRGKRQLVA